MCHASPIRIAQQLIAHVQRRFKHGDPGKAASRLGSQQSFNVPNWIEAANSQPRGICADHGWKLPWHEQAPTQEVCPRIASAVFQKACSFWIKKRRRKAASQKPTSKISQGRNPRRNRQSTYTQRHL